MLIWHPSLYPQFLNMTMSLAATGHQCVTPAGVTECCGWDTLNTKPFYGFL